MQSNEIKLEIEGHKMDYKKERLLDKKYIEYKYNSYFIIF